MYDVIAVGSATVDVFAHTESELIKIKTSNFEEDLIAYPSGSKIIIQKLEFKIGGGGTNTAVSFARLGMKTAFLGKLGKDENGDKVISLLKKEKIDFIGARGKEQTGYSIILDSIEEDRTILTSKGANDTLAYSELDAKGLSTKWFYFSSMMGKSLLFLEKISSLAKEKDQKIAFNPSIYLIKENPARVKNILENTSLLIYNLEEATALVGMGSVNEQLVNSSRLGPGVVVITDGRNGCFAYDGLFFYSMKPRKINVVETTGAGDAFASAFLAGMIKKGEIEFALNLAMTNAESVVQHIGAKEILLTYPSALSTIKRYPHPIKKERVH